MAPQKGAEAPSAGTGQTLTQVLQLHVAQDVEAALLEVVDEVDEAGAAAWVLHHQQHLWAPELDVVLPHVQHQQVLPHLGGEGQQVRSPHSFDTPPLEGTPAPKPSALRPTMGFGGGTGLTWWKMRAWLM